MERINLVELLKDCIGMELDCAVFNHARLEKINSEEDREYPIQVNTLGGCTISLTKYGTYIDAPDAKCVIFPKGKTSWEGFVPPCQFKDGDIVVSSLGNIHILKNRTTSYIYVDFAHNSKGSLCKSLTTSVNAIRLATEEEKSKLFKAIKEHGYIWNPETKNLEKFVVPKFKGGN